ncbi:hypothetical protein DOTSEDRAFT_50804 [Dothistroma septosporum NZE10]|uniref:Uncharacterized protein n=1 Tax=Dothistroma septosporum (strain NZE10 / CBS 128990) TaxID=675120 RepID=N1PVJ4_DOTSN|nr:hypothetical protein DOTSEDRAFT_50804 [Dothistroma septosporum NZE10]
MTKIACYGPHPMTGASSQTTITRSGSGFVPDTFAEESVSMIRPTRTGTAVSAGFPTAETCASSKSTVTFRSTSIVTLRRTTFITLPTSAETSPVHTSSTPEAIPVVMLTIRHKVHDFCTMLGSHRDLDTSQDDDTVRLHSALTPSHQRSKSWSVILETPPQLFPETFPFGAPGPVMGNPVFLNGVDGINGSRLPVSSVVVPKNSYVAPSSSNQYSQGNEDNDALPGSTCGSEVNDADVFTVYRLPVINPWATKPGIDQAATDHSHATPAASSGRRPRPSGPHNGTVPTGTGKPWFPKHPHAESTRIPQTETMALA